jgi:chitosanase
MVIKIYTPILMFLVLFFSISPCLAGSNAKNAMLQMTTTLENSETQLQWNYAENLGDGRGITFGCIGFCTGTYDGNILIKYYTKLNPDNTLAKYIPALDKIDAGSHNAAEGDGSPSTTGLSGFIKDVQKCNDPLFKQAQLYELDQLYYNPAVKMYNNVGAKNALTLAFIYDMCIRHGSDDAQEIIDNAGKTPKQGADENTYLSKLISLRDAKLKSEGLGDVDRDAGHKNLLKSGNVDLKTPFTFVAYGDTFTIDGDLGLYKSASGESSNERKVPSASFNAKPTNGKVPIKVQFTDKSTGSPTSWKWSFGDGAYSTKKNPLHKYSKAGKYTVSLTVKNAEGSNTKNISGYITVKSKRTY